jgi:hypothetical protein
VASIGAVTSSNVIGVGLTGSESVILKSVNINSGESLYLTVYFNIILLTIPMFFFTAEMKMFILE